MNSAAVGPWSHFTVGTKRMAGIRLLLLCSAVLAAANPPSGKTDVLISGAVGERWENWDAGE